jgi:hypothetical protein
VGEQLRRTLYHEKDRVIKCQNRRIATAANYLGREKEDTLSRTQSMTPRDKVS